MTPAVKTHVSVLLGVLALIKAVDYYFQRLELVLSRSHVVNGATATSVHADKPALTLLIAIAVIAAVLFLYNIRQKGWTLPAVAVGLWVLVYILVGAVYPALYQALRVNPSELTRETPYIQRNIDATRAAYGLNNVQVDTSLQLQPDGHDLGDPGHHRHRRRPTSRPSPTSACSIRPCSWLNTFDKYQALRSYYQFNELDLDRYPMPTPARHDARQLVATIASVRELNTVGAVRIRQPASRVHPRLRGGAGPDQPERGQLRRRARTSRCQNLPPTGTPSLSADRARRSTTAIGTTPAAT